MADPAWPWVWLAVACGFTFVVGCVVGQVWRRQQEYACGHRDGIAVGWEARGQARHEGAIDDWQWERDPAAWGSAQGQEGPIGDGFDAARLEAATKAWRTGQQVVGLMGACADCGEIHCLTKRDGRWVCEAPGTCPARQEGGAS